MVFLYCYKTQQDYCIRMNGQKTELEVPRNSRPEDLAKRILELSLGEVSFEFDRKLKPNTPGINFFLRLSQFYRQITGEIPYPKLDHQSF